MKYIHTDSNIPEENEYPKLVRDGIPKIIKEHDNINVDMFCVKNTKEHLQYLQKKIVEEATELSVARTQDHLVEEIVDVLEVIDTICDISSISKEDIFKVQKEKKQKRGSFLGGFVMNKKV